MQSKKSWKIYYFQWSNRLRSYLMDGGAVEMPPPPTVEILGAWGA